MPRPGDEGGIKTLNLILVGQRGVGKSTAGKDVAERVGAPFLDTDEEVERATGMTVSRIFENMGEAAFREAERKIVSRIGDLEDHVISAGGGAPLDPRNREILRAAGLVVWLHASPRILLSRCADRKRPPLTDLPLEEEVERIANERRPVYDEVSRVKIDTDMLSYEEVVQELERIWRKLPLSASPRRSPPPLP